MKPGVLPPRSAFSIWPIRLVTRTESAVATEPCKNTISGSGFSLLACEGLYKHAYRSEASASFHGPTTLPPKQIGLWRETELAKMPWFTNAGGSPKGLH